MPHTVHPFEHPFLHRIFVGYMTIVASGIPSVGAVHPCGVVRSHNMTVDTGSRIVAQISMCPEHIQEEQPSAHNQPWQSNGNPLPSSGRKPPIDNLFYFHKTQINVLREQSWGKKRNQDVIYITLCKKM